MTKSCSAVPLSRRRFFRVFYPHTSQSRLHVFPSGISFTFSLPAYVSVSIATRELFIGRRLTPLEIPANKQHLALVFNHAKVIWKTKLYLRWIKEAREIMLLGVFTVSVMHMLL